MGTGWLKGRMRALGPFLTTQARRAVVVWIALLAQLPIPSQSEDTHWWLWPLQPEPEGYHYVGTRECLTRLDPELANSIDWSQRSVPGLVPRSVPDYIQNRELWLGEAPTAPNSPRYLSNSIRAHCWDYRSPEDGTTVGSPERATSMAQPPSAGAITF